MIYFINIIIGLILSIILGRVFIPLLRKLHAGQSIREDGPKSHLVKSGTPTIGGIIFLSSVLITILITGNFKISVFMILFSTFAFGAIGFIDDYIKVVKKRNLGLRAYQKLFLQIIASVILIIYQSNSKNMSTDLYIPFLKDYINIGLLYIPFIIFVVVGTVNSVNLTDGLDGLSSSVTIICLLFFTICSVKFNRPEIAIFCLALSGALIGFLFYNKYPAKVFMGDTGSLALGGAISAIAILLNIPLILPIAGGIYFIETLSVIIQVISFKTTGKRVFLMSPLHHHFEHKGWHETKIVAVFSIVEIILCIISYIILF
ncbi:phospho-N-acetylmuramoyl-pentapeptide-transferase [Peptoniphilus sp. MSJ-1]|uniref:Phospho-N-acetylmuramoyl-pentapeptide-transferase n=1 Tax=Peptoniphilus ovalis TaxID=2841503 RepID=A0ABS6FIQ2_9FIRM|nr:phospho-N-acetylmuramoyl-pentapeptide-transferase [Peptoniphilus ovalis]MBU5669090.1 phospho-N-acetylmuramoyl-pentapeptide-transferase [Peptoniphilus ovalis]